MICKNCGGEGSPLKNGDCPFCLVLHGHYECPVWMDEEDWIAGVTSGWEPIKGKSKKQREQEAKTKEALDAWQPKPKKNNS